MYRNICRDISVHAKVKVRINIVQVRHGTICVLEFSSAPLFTQLMLSAVELSRERGRLGGARLIDCRQLITQHFT